MHMIAYQLLQFKQAISTIVDKQHLPSPCLEVLDDGSATFLNHDQSIPDYVQRVALRQFVTKKPR